MSKPTIMLVEDEPSIAEMLYTLLTEEDYIVVLVNNGQAGLRALRDMGTSPDLILSDVMLPVMDGREMVRQLQAIPAYANIPVIFMSAANLSHTLTGLKYTTFLMKPFSLDALLKTISQALTNSNGY